MDGIDPDKISAPDMQIISILYPIFKKEQLDRDAVAVNKGMFGGQ
jgi:hypothetical protein